MPALRHIKTVPDLGAPIVAGRDSDTGDEVWLVDPSATAEEIVKGCSSILADLNDQCATLRARGQRRALWLFLAAILGLLLPSPIRPLYAHHGWALHAGDWTGAVATVALLGLALREHLAIRRLCKR